MASQNFSFLGGKQNYSISTTEGDDVTVNVTSNSSGEINTIQTSATKIERLSIIGTPTTGVIAIDPGIVQFGTIAVFALGNGSFLSLGAPTATSNIYATGHSNTDHFIIFDRSSAADPTQHHITALYSTIVLNGEESPLSAYVTDLGGNDVWANSGRLEYELQAPASLGYQSNIFAAKNRGEFIIYNALPTITDEGTSDESPQTSSTESMGSLLPGGLEMNGSKMAGSLSLVLDVAQRDTSGYAPYYYTVTQTSDVHTILYQKEGVLNFYGQDTTLVLNGKTSSVLSSLSLNDNNTLWNGNSTSFVNIGGTNNSIYSSGSGDIAINLGTFLTPSDGGTTAQANSLSLLTLLASASSLEPLAAVPASDDWEPITGTEKTLVIKGVGDTTGRIYYNQNHENVTVSDLKNTFMGILRAGVSNIDVGTFTPKGETTFYVLSIGQGADSSTAPSAISSEGENPETPQSETPQADWINEVDVTIKNFSLSQGIDPTSHNILQLATGVTATSSFDGKNTIFALSGATTGRVTFTNVDLSGADPFTHLNAFLPGA
ncbi:hypothetical protein [Entomobacter blattae]|uniref:Uncharacterized protein n=1 Tax=Entomobacter blattae TaxID=2762277 RepID=A0A7H1NQY0_9PROT|nr:hypothetical protein [Entomobacter blattae]QNT78190.1 hypothetical protein JGUZn3_09590 [Entomobacter blattae]